MQRSTDRILTTHVGSLIRTREIIDGMKARTLGQPYDQAALQTAIHDGIRQIVRKQVEIGIDVPNDGEYSRTSFTAYINERLSGLEPRPLQPGERNPLDQVGHQLERAAFRDFYEQYDRTYRFQWMLPGVATDELRDIRAKSELFRLTGPITYRGADTLRGDLDTLRGALNGLNVADAFVTAVSPTTERKDREVLEYYPSHRAYLYALADALREEYRAITDAGFILQLDRPAQNPVLNLAGDDV